MERQGKGRQGREKEEEKDFEAGDAVGSCDVLLP
jgi:hypothetical protein